MLRSTSVYIGNVSVTLSSIPCSHNRTASPALSFIELDLNILPLLPFPNSLLRPSIYPSPLKPLSGADHTGISMITRPQKFPRNYKKGISTPLLAATQQASARTRPERSTKSDKKIIPCPRRPRRFRTSGRRWGWAAGCHGLLGDQSGVLCRGPIDIVWT